VSSTDVRQAGLADAAGDGFTAPPGIGSEMHGLLEELFPLCRSLTGDGVRETLRLLGRWIPLEITEVDTGSPIFDWTVPREWNVRDAWVTDPAGRRVVDFRDSNLHVLGYSVPVRLRLPLSELREHIYVDPERPDVVPYRTSYWTERWGFCMSQRQLDGLPEGEYEVLIDSTLEDGAMTYAECVVEAPDADAEVLVSTYVCHPSLANDNLSGVVVAATLARQLARVPLRASYRFLFSPGTVGPSRGSRRTSTGWTGSRTASF
jgi:aminopeptidase-like protein